MIRQKNKSKRRRGATAVEFALVLPVVLVFVFTIFEISKLMLIEGNVSSAVLVGVRRASLIDSTPQDVDSTIRAELSRYGISEATINFTPQSFDHSDLRLEITVSAPISVSNGVYFGDIVNPDLGVTKTIGFDREN